MTSPRLVPPDYPALVCRFLSDDFSGLELRALALAGPGPEDVLIRVRAAALNFPDVLMAQGRYQFKPPLPFVPGMEAAGEVVAVGGNVSGVAPAQQVVASVRFGAFATYLRVDASHVRAMPPGLTWAEAAAYQTAALTAQVALVERGGLAAGETLLVHGASGGVGTAAVQLGRHLGARVIATGRSQAKLEQARRAGAHETIQLDGDLRERVMQLTAGAGVDVVFDPVGGDLFDASLRCLGWGGRLLVIGFVSGRIAEAKANYLLIKNLSVIGVRAGESGRRDPARGAATLREIDRLAAEGVLRPLISDELPLARAVEGMRRLAAGEVAGKLVIAM
jgi:NADPH2:quinone reductase